MKAQNGLFPFAPAVYEHKADLIGESPFSVSRSADLLTRALEKELEIYRPDAITVGVDIYNLELEAIGATVEEKKAGCPELALIPAGFELRTPDYGKEGRFALMLEAASRIAERSDVPVRVAATGPVTLAAKVIGFEDLLIGLFTEDEAVAETLDRCEAIAAGWLHTIRNAGFDAVLFDSTASPPLVGPDQYRSAVLPRHARLMQILADSGQAERELVMGGDTTSIAAELKATNANILLCDFAANAAAWKKALGDDDTIHVRRNLPLAFLNGSDYPAKAEQFLQDLRYFTHPITGSGILPCGFRPEYLTEFRRHLEESFNCF